MYICIYLTPRVKELSCDKYGVTGGRDYVLRVDYAERRNEYGILFIFSLFCEYNHLEYVHVHVIYSVNQAEIVTHVVLLLLLHSDL